MDAVISLLGNINAPLRRLKAYAPIVVRVVLGLTMFWHGYKKFDAGISGFEGFLDFLSIPLPGFFAYVVALLELVGGILIVLGFATRLISVLFIIQLLVAVLRYKYGEDVGMIGAAEAGAELDWALIAGFFVLAVGGPGKMSLDHKLGVEKA